MDAPVVRIRRCAPAWLGFWRSRGGVPVRLRPIRPEDAGRELEFLNHLSDQSRYQRLLSPRKLLPGELQRLVHVDYVHEMALVAVIAGANGDEIMLGVARYVVTSPEGSTAPAIAEFAIVIADAWQGSGLGTVLLASLMHVAAKSGVGTFRGTALSLNRGMIALGRKLGLAVHRIAGEGVVVELEGPLPSREAEIRQRMFLFEVPQET